MFKNEGGGGGKGLLKNVKKKQKIWLGRTSLKYQVKWGFSPTTQEWVLLGAQQNLTAIQELNMQRLPQLGNYTTSCALAK